MLLTNVNLSCIPIYNFLSPHWYINPIQSKGWPSIVGMSASSIGASQQLRSVPLNIREVFLHLSIIGRLLSLSSSRCARGLFDLRLQLQSWLFPLVWFWSFYCLAVRRMIVGQCEGYSTGKASQDTVQLRFSRDLGWHPQDDFTKKKWTVMGNLRERVNDNGFIILTGKGSLWDRWLVTKTKSKYLIVF